MAYLIVRATYIPLVHDEAETFFSYILPGYYLPYEGYIAANNHFLNSFLGHWCFKLFGSSTLSLRIPNLLSFPIYLFFLYRISNEMKSKMLALALFVSLSTTTFLIEFFALTRGYGLGYAFLLAFIFNYGHYLKNRTFKNLVSTQVFLWLGLSATLTYFHLYVIFIATLVFELIVCFRRESQIDGWKKLFFLLLFTIPVAMFILKYTLFLNSIGEINVGNFDGFYASTFESSVELLTGTKNIFPQILFVSAITVILAG
ncbi:MAG TPA: hypothetical protein VIY47_01395, partial [Ignavibacteriaceae bacterium]